MSGITRVLARHIASVTYADLPTRAVLAAKRSLLDAIGVSLGASRLEPARAPIAALALRMRGGTTHELRVLRPLGHPDNPLTQERLVAKFVDCAGRAARPLTRDRSRLAAQAILTIEQAASAAQALRPACLPG
jgi:2-methylcitrate dehydratase PrpD